MTRPDIDAYETAEEEHGERLTEAQAEVETHFRNLKTAHRRWKNMGYDQRVTPAVFEYYQKFRAAKKICRPLRRREAELQAAREHNLASLPPRLDKIWGQAGSWRDYAGGMAVLDTPTGRAYIAPTHVTMTGGATKDDAAILASVKHAKKKWRGGLTMNVNADEEFQRKVLAACKAQGVKVHWRNDPPVQASGAIRDGGLPEAAAEPVRAVPQDRPRHLHAVPALV